MTARIGTLAGSSASSSRREPNGATSDDVRKRLRGHSEQIEELGRPLARLDIHQLRA